MRAGIRSRRSPTTYAIFTALFAFGARSLQLDVRPLRQRLHGAVRRHLGRVDRRQRAAPDDGRRGRRRPQPLPRCRAVVGFAARRRRAVFARADRGACDRQLREELRGKAPRRGRAARVVHQDGDCFSRRELGRADDGSERLRRRADPDGRRGDVRRVPVLLADRLYARAPRVRVQARRGGRARVGHLRVRRVRGHRDGRRDSREARHPRHGLDGRRDLRDARAHRPAGRSTRRSRRISRSSTARRSA